MKKRDAVLFVDSENAFNAVNKGKHRFHCLRVLVCVSVATNLWFWAVDLSILLLMLLLPVKSTEEFPICFKQTIFLCFICFSSYSFFIIVIINYDLWLGRTCCDIVIVSEMFSANVICLQKNPWQLLDWVLKTHLFFLIILK